MIPQLDVTTLFTSVVNGFISFFFGVLGGVVSHWTLRRMNEREKEAERRRTLKRRVLKAPKYSTVDQLRKFAAPIMAFIPVLIIAVVFNWVWLILGVALVFGVVVGLTWNA